MFARRKLAKRFSLLLLEDEEDYVADWAASCKWPSNVEGNWQGLAALPGRLRLCTKSLFFEPDDVRAPIVRYVSCDMTMCLHCARCVAHSTAECCHIVGRCYCQRTGML
jgi:hypothetical protein